MQFLNELADGREILGTGDFNADGKDNLMCGNPTATETVGLLGYWNGGSDWVLVGGYSPDWEMVGTGDFNGDGTTDMLWRNSFEGADGKTYNGYCIWLMDVTDNSWKLTGVACQDDWDLLCTGDFNADGTTDIAMINGDNTVGIWGVEDAVQTSWTIVNGAVEGWTFADAGDFNADGKDEIAWFNTDSNLCGYWTIDLDGTERKTIWSEIGILA